MINHINITFNDGALPNLKIGHNNQTLFSEIKSNIVDFDVYGDTTIEQVLWIENSGDHDIEINSLSMFGHGSDKLKFLGSWTSKDGSTEFPSHWIHAHGRWTIKYQYPTFSWLHEKLHYGWLVKPVE